MNSILSDLYHGELRPNERDYPDGSDTGILLESFREDEKWLAQMLDGKAKEYLLERARKKLRRRKKDRQSPLEELIIALVNTEQFSYTYGSVRDMTIYQFNESLRQIAHKIDYDNRMRENYMNKYAKTSRYDTRNYDLVITADGKTEEQIVDLIMTYIG